MNVVFWLLITTTNLIPCQMSRHRHLDTWVAEARDEFDEEDSFDFSKQAHSDVPLFERDTEVLAKYYGDDSWYNGWVVDTTADGFVLVTFEGYEDDGPQETDPADVKLRPDDAEEVPNLDLDTFNARAEEVKAVLGSEVKDGDIKNALARCSFDSAKTIAFLLDWIDGGKKETLGTAPKPATIARKPAWEPLPAKQPRKSPAVSKSSPAQSNPKNKVSSPVAVNKKTPAKAALPSPAAAIPTEKLGDDMEQLGLDSVGRAASVGEKQQKCGGGDGKEEEDEEEEEEYRFDSVEGDGGDGDGEETVSLIVVGHVDAGKSTLNGHLMVLLGRVDQRLMHKYKREAQTMVPPPPDLAHLRLSPAPRSSPAPRRPAAARSAAGPSSPTAESESAVPPRRRSQARETDGDEGA